LPRLDLHVRPVRQVAELQELERVIEVAESAVETDRDGVRLETGIFDPQSIR
jgi:hypothetical protein